MLPTTSVPTLATARAGLAQPVIGRAVVVVLDGDDDGRLQLAAEHEHRGEEPLRLLARAAADSVGVLEDQHERPLARDEDRPEPVEASRSNSSRRALRSLPSSR